MTIVFILKILLPIGFLIGLFWGGYSFGKKIGKNESYQKRLENIYESNKKAQRIADSIRSREYNRDDSRWLYDPLGAKRNDD